jgi:hypothetical protein
MPCMKPIFLPLGGIVFDVFRNDQICVGVADDVFVKIALPDGGWGALRRGAGGVGVRNCLGWNIGFDVHRRMDCRGRKFSAPAIRTIVKINVRTMRTIVWTMRTTVTTWVVKMVPYARTTALVHIPFRHADFVSANNGPNRTGYHFLKFMSRIFVACKIIARFQLQYAVDMIWHDDKFMEHNVGIMFRNVLPAAMMLLLRVASDACGHWRYVRRDVSFSGCRW